MTSPREVHDQSGRVLGPRALETRSRLLEAAEKLLGSRKLRDLRVIDMAREIGASAATFYQYFRDVDDVALCLAEQTSDEMPGMLEQIDGSWRGPDGIEKARAIVEAFIEHWDAHHAVLRVRNLASDEGDAGFQALREKTMRPVLQELARVIAEHREADGFPGHPAAAAAAMASILERLAAYHQELEVFGVTREDLVESSAHILQRTVTGE